MRKRYFVIFWLAQSLTEARAEQNKTKLDPHCTHGDWHNATKSCKCWDGWRTAGITDTIDFIEGHCEQFNCLSDKYCQKKLGIAEASCPVKGWNCYCGWGYAFHDNWHGYDPWKEGRIDLDGECMGVMYTFSVDATSFLTKFMEWAWVPFVVAAVLLLPFGRKRAVCDHHRPSMWNWFRRCFGVQIECNGGCVMSSIYTFDMLKDDLAWSLYALDLMVWTYIFTGTLLITAAWICSLVVWLVILIILLCFAVAGVCMACLAGAEGCELGSCDCCGVFGGGDAGAAAGTEGGCECCGICGTEAAQGGATGGTEAFFWGGPMFHDPYMGFWWSTPYYGGGHHDECCCCCDRRNRVCQFFCKPVALLLFVFPVMPENMWGGIAGRFFFGTHHMTPPHQLYTGGSWFIDRLMGQRPIDLHDDGAWRTMVHNYVADELNEPDFTAAHVGQYQGVHPAGHVIELGAQNSRHCHAIQVHRQFELDSDRVWSSSFEDYKSNNCWICQQESDEWDLWLSCRHLFCKNCSGTMLRRRMPCPLCRVSSCTVLRGYKYEEEAPADIRTPSTVASSSAVEKTACLVDVPGGPASSTDRYRGPQANNV